MLFNSYLFVFIFLPVSLLGYYLSMRKIGNKAAKLWLIVMSLCFYGSFRLEYLLILLVSVGLNYAVCIGVQHAGGKASGNGKPLLILGVAGNLALLGYFKYTNFFIENLNAVSGMRLSSLQLLLPIGISFFTFQQISFLVDVYRGEIRECGWIDYVLYITYFPKLVEGPLVKHEELLPQFEEIGRKQMDGERFVKGVVLFVLGMLKKVILADTFGGAVNYGYSNLEIMHGSDALLLVLFYSLQLYFDFSGYCDMARGISWMFGIELPVNFNSPYKARNIIDFWKRWHITLNRFFTKYVYIPLGGNREGKVKMYRNLLLIFLLSGIWHGAGWNFILWGMMHGVLYVITRMWQERNRQKSAANISGRAQTDGQLKRETSGNGTRILSSITHGMGVIVTFLYVNVAWVYFRAESVAQGNALLRKIFENDFPRINRNLAGYFNLDEFWYILKVLRLDQWEYGHYLLMFVITAVALLLVFWGKNAAQVAERIKPKLWNALLFAGLFLWCVLTFSNVSTFLYFNF